MQFIVSDWPKMKIDKYSKFHLKTGKRNGGRPKEPLAHEVKTPPNPNHHTAVPQRPDQAAGTMGGGRLIKGNACGQSAREA